MYSCVAGAIAAHAALAGVVVLQIVAGEAAALQVNVHKQHDCFTF